MNLTSKAKKQITKNLFELFEKEDITAATVPDHEGKVRLVVMDGQVFSDFRTESDQMKQWIHAMIGEVWKLFNDDGTVKMTEIAQIQRLGTFCVDAQSRFLSYNPAEVMKEKIGDKDD